MNEDPQAKIAVQGVTKAYGNVPALRETTLSVDTGEFLTLLGPSGSGKTTLLMLLAGLITPDQGDVYINGSLATHVPAYDRDIGLVFQNYALFPHLTVFENVAFPLRMRRIPEDAVQRKVSQILELVRLPHVSHRLPRELSGGQQQRIALARCAVYEPSVILMDEPLGALDKKLRDQMQLEIKRLHKALRITMIYVTHDQEEAMAMSNRICLMNAGAIEQLGTPEELYFRPSTIFAADFLGSSNIYEAVRTANGAQICGCYDVVLPLDRDRADSTDKLALMIRPEHIRLLANDAVEDNTVCATLEQSVVTGALTRLFARLDSGQQIVASMLTMSPDRLPAGSRLRLGWSRNHTILLPRPTKT